MHAHEFRHGHGTAADSGPQITMTSVDVNAATEVLQQTQRTAVHLTQTKPQLQMLTACQGYVSSAALIVPLQCPT
jgi:hypothetical protein